MAKDKSKITDENLLKATSKMIMDILLSHSASSEDIESGIYEPINKNSSLINLEKLLVSQDTAPEKIQPKASIFSWRKK